MKIKLIVIVAFVLPFFSALAEEICQREDKFIQGVRLTRGTYPSTKRCFISIGQRNPKDLFYRDFSFSSDGQLMIFSSYGDGPVSKTTGAKEYHFFPRIQNPTYEFLEKSVVITMSNGDKVTFDLLDASPLSIERGTFTFNEDIKIGDKGGFEINQYDGLVLNSGFTMGMNPTWNLSRSSTFIFPNAERCTLSNKEIFVKKSNEIFWRHSSDKELMSFLDKRC